MSGSIPENSGPGIPASSTATPAESINDDRSEPPADSISFVDLELMHHYSTSTCHVMSDSDDSGLWQHEFPKMGMQSRPIMHLILALAALHLESLKSSSTSDDDLRFRAEHHFSCAIPHFLGSLAKLDSHSQKPLQAAAALIGLYYLARGPVTGQYIAFADHEGDAEGYRLLQGVKQIMMVASHKTDNQHETRTSPSTSRQAPLTNMLEPFNYKEALNNLLEIVIRVCNSHEAHSKFARAIDDLRRSFAARFETGEHRKEDAIVFKWLYEQQSEFIQALKLKHPAALLIYAHFAVLLTSMNDPWHIRGWAVHIIQGVEKHLSVKLHPYLLWPKIYILRK